MQWLHNEFGEDTELIMQLAMLLAFGIAFIIAVIIEQNLYHKHDTPTE